MRTPVRLAVLVVSAAAPLGPALAGCATGSTDVPDATSAGMDAALADAPLADLGPEAAVVPGATIALVTPMDGAQIYRFMTGTTTPYPNALEVRTNVWALAAGSMSDQCAVGFVDLDGRCTTPVLNPTMADLHGAAIPTLSFRLTNCDVTPVDMFGRDFGNFRLTFRPAVRSTAVQRMGPTGVITTCEYVMAFAGPDQPISAQVQVDLRNAPP